MDLKRTVLLVAMSIWGIAGACSRSTQYQTTKSDQSQGAEPDTTRSFFFIFCGDTRFGATSEKDHPEIFYQIVEEANLRGPDFFLHGGDGPDFDTEENYRTFKEAMDRLTMRYYIVIGNHDVYIKGQKRNSRKHYRDFFGDPYYTFDYRNAYFIVLDTAGEVLMEWGIKASYPDGSEWRWLEQELETNRSKYEYLFVVMHVPPYDPPPEITDTQDHAFKDSSEAEAFEHLMAQYDVSMVLCSHDHLYYRTVKEGVPYLVSGGAGANLYALPERGGFYHYVEIHVASSGITERVIPVFQSLRVQPASVTLKRGEAREFAGRGVDPIGRSIELGPPMSTVWASSDTIVGIVDAGTGRFVARSAGTTLVTLTCGLKTATASVNVEGE